MCFFEYTCQECGDFADPAVFHPTRGIICEECLDLEKDQKEPETVKTERIRK